MRIQTEMADADEFDTYFAEADVTAALQQAAADTRRGSLPPGGLLVPSSDRLPRRTASCKYPSVRRRSGHSPSPLAHLDPAPQYALEPTLRAPSPRPDARCRSAPQSRSSSWKNMKRPSSFRNLAADDDDDDDNRSGSVPFEECVSAKLDQLRLLAADDCCVVRNFATSSKGIVNRGDSFKRKTRSDSNGGGGDSAGSTPSSVGKVSQLERNIHLRERCPPPPAQPARPAIHKVAMLGDHGVGKTSLLQQFMTSEYMGAANTSFEDECQRTVSVLLDGEETMIEFIDKPSSPRTPDETPESEVEAYIVVYSITDLSSFQSAVHLVHSLVRRDGPPFGVILVANKSDLVRKRKVSADEAKQTCRSYQTKYIELSAALNHRVDDLLAGIASQIRLNPARQARHLAGDTTAKPVNCISSAKGLIGRLFRKQTPASSSCENLLTL